MSKLGQVCAPLPVGIRSLCFAWGEEPSLPRGHVPVEQPLSSMRGVSLVFEHF